MTLSPRHSLAAGLLCLALAVWLAPGVRSFDSTGDGTAGDARPVMEPLARALVPLGPVRAVVSSALWMMVQRKQQDGDPDAVADLAEGLLALHPELEEVRVFLARQLVVSQAPRSPDDALHRALVARGLRMLEDGPPIRDSERLHAALGTLLALQVDMDPRFAPVAAQYFGERPEEVAISELRRARQGGRGALNLIILLVDRGLNTLRRGGDPFEAARDLEEATDVLQLFNEEDRMVIAAELEGLKELRRQLDVPAADDEDRRS